MPFHNLLLYRPGNMTENSNSAPDVASHEIVEEFLPQILRTGNAQGGKAVPLEFSIKRELTLADLTELDAPKGSKPDAIQVIRNSHHQIAHLLAQGHGPTMVSAMTGMTISRISTLKNSPAFAELIEFYVEREGEILLDTTRQLKLLGDEAVSKIQERLEDDPDVTMGQLISIGQFALDRAGHGPTSTQINVDAPLSQQDIIALMQEAKENQSGNVTIIEERAIEVPTETQDNSQPKRSETEPQSLAQSTEIVPLSNTKGTEV